MKRGYSILVILVFSALLLQAQENESGLQFYKTPGYESLNVFETTKEADGEFDGLEIRVGGDFALQFQGLDHSNASGAPDLIPLGKNVNLPTANLNFDAQLHKGVRMHLRVFLSSRHHNETWVKGGHIQIDRLDFIKPGFASELMDKLTLRAGVDQPNYGDAMFRRTDNATAIYNPFVGNYIMDAYTVEPFVEATLHLNDFFVVGGLTNGIYNPTVDNSSTAYGSSKFAGEKDDLKPTYYGKVGYDSQQSEDLRIRLTGSVYSAQGADNGNHLYAGDRAGARYYNVLDYISPADSSIQSGFRSGRFNPGFNKETAIQINPFIKYKGLEFFGVFENTTGNNGREGQQDGSYTQLGAELLQRFGSWNQFYLAARYNSVTGHANYAEGTDEPESTTISRVNIGGGYFMTKNTLVKLEYVTQNYDDNFSGHLQDANFSGVVLEAVISF